MTEIRTQNNEQYRQSPLWLYGVVLIVLFIASIFIGVVLLRPFSYFEFFQAISSTTITLSTVLLTCTAVAIITLTKSLFYKLVLSICAIGFILLALSGMGWLFVWFSLMIAPIAFIWIIGYGAILIAIRFKRHIHLQETLSFLLLSLIFTLSIISTTWYMIIRYDILESQTIDNTSYHLTSFTGYLASPMIELQRCTFMGLLCKSLYTVPDDYYNNMDHVYWQVTEGENSIITIFVNDEAIHTETLNHSSD